MNPDDLKKLLEEYSKKYTDDPDDYKYYTDVWDKKYDPYDELSLSKDDGRAWGAYDPDFACQITTGPGGEPSTPGCSYTEKEREEVKARWTGALAKFAVHVNFPGYGYNAQNLMPDRAVPFNPNMTGAVFEVEVNYQDRWMAQVLWANGDITSEKIDDLVIIQVPPST